MSVVVAEVVKGARNEILEWAIDRGVHDDDCCCERTVLRLTVRKTLDKQVMLRCRVVIEDMARASLELGSSFLAS